MNPFVNPMIHVEAKGTHATPVDTEGIARFVQNKTATSFSSFAAFSFYHHHEYRI